MRIEPTDGVFMLGQFKSVLPVADLQDSRNEKHPGQQEPHPKIKDRGNGCEKAAPQIEQREQSRLRDTAHAKYRRMSASNENSPGPRAIT